MADDFTVTLLHQIQNERTAPGNGWLSTGQIARGMHLADHEEHHALASLKELHEAGMIEKRFNFTKAVDEWRSRGVQPDIRHSTARPLSTGLEEFTITVTRTNDAEVVLTAAVNQLRDAGAPVALTSHFSFRLGYHTASLPIRDAVAWAAKECAIGVIFA
jgi:hypothetical protein